MGHLLNNKDAVVCKTQEEWDTIMAIADKEGIKTCHNLRREEFSSWPRLRYDDFYGIVGSNTEGTAIPITEFIAKMLGIAPAPPPIKIGEHTVVFGTSSIKVGCTEVPHDTLKAVYERVFGGKG